MGQFVPISHRDKMGEVQLPLPGKIFCILCNGVVSFKNGDRSRFIGHMNHEPEAFSGVSFILAGCLMSQEERSAVETIMEEKYNSGNIEMKRVEDVTIEIDQEVVAEEKIEINVDKESEELLVTVGDEEPSSSSKVELKKKDLEDKSDGKVRISMRNFLLENKNLSNLKAKDGDAKYSVNPEKYLQVENDETKITDQHTKSFD